MKVRSSGTCWFNRWSRPTLSKMVIFWLLAPSLWTAYLGSGPWLQPLTLAKSARPKVTANFRIVLPQIIFFVTLYYFLLGPAGTMGTAVRSEERRVGKECRSRWARDHEK